MKFMLLAFPSQREKIINALGIQQNDREDNSKNGIMNYCPARMAGSLSPYILLTVGSPLLVLDS